MPSDAAQAAYDARMATLEAAFEFGRIDKDKFNTMSANLLEQLMATPLVAPSEHNPNRSGLSDATGPCAVSRSSKRPWAKESNSFDTMDLAVAWVKDPTNHDGHMYSFLHSREAREKAFKCVAHKECYEGNGHRLLLRAVSDELVEVLSKGEHGATSRPRGLSSTAKEEIDHLAGDDPDNEWVKMEQGNQSPPAKKKSGESARGLRTSPRKSTCGPQDGFAATEAEVPEATTQRKRSKPKAPGAPGAPGASAAKKTKKGKP